MTTPKRDSKISPKLLEAITFAAVASFRTDRILSSLERRLAEVTDSATLQVGLQWERSELGRRISSLDLEGARSDHRAERKDFAAEFIRKGGAAIDLAMHVYAVNPTNLGFIKVWPANGTEPDVSTVNYQVGITAIATGTLVPVDQANSNRFSAKSPATVEFSADVVGYFKPPGDGTSLDFKVAGAAGDAL